MLTKKIDKKQVEDFLLKNPDFFCDTPSILSRLNFPVKEESGEKNIVSFKDWMISSLKNQKKEIIENAKHNYFTQRKIHSSILNIIKFSNFKNFMSFMKNDFRKSFDLEMVNLICPNEKFCSEFNLLFLEESKIEKIYNCKNSLIMDATDQKLGIVEEQNIYSNAIFSLDEKIFDNKALIFFGSKDNRFITNRAYDLISFLSKIIEYKLKELM